ncbi:DUF4386 domain-containing protein [Methanolobus bombayensis]|uniref:DUF4386 domain-containing protein n=1 Tax=Methanolobus bombayensis TaxID=38023 RepID=UPI001AE7E953|nr:DUF4386 domain-containing protein [Methanolobus bombayensis]MBP1910207.1 hypothetical protein [Methanolobus bombayensis]
MTNNLDGDISLRKAAIIAGFSYLIIFILGIVANFVVLMNLFVPENASATVDNIMSNLGQFRMGILGFIIMVIFDVIVAWALYLLLSPVSKGLSLLAAWLRLVNATIFGIAMFNLFSVLRLFGEASYLTELSTGQMQVQVMSLLYAFNDTWLIGLIFFGLHLAVLGYLIFRSGYIPKFIGILLMIAAIGYLADSFASFLMSNYADYAGIFMIIVIVPGVIGELSFTLWLLIKGRKLELQPEMN